MWQHRYDYLPTHEPFLTPKLATSPNYIDWFRHNNKSYLLPNAKRSMQHRHKRPRRGPINPRSREHAAGGSTSGPARHEDPIVVQPPDQYSVYFAPSPPTAPYYTPMSLATPMYPVLRVIPTFYPQYGLCDTIQLSIVSVANTPASLLYRVGSSLQPHIHIGGCMMDGYDLDTVNHEGMR
ncbi:hypothetical protein Gotri_016403 [Gossypium trilobum]|uniref:Uncharacterized protein n=1 Tax=Gossypium trilobum TaxID=34281 RepID=A0A7J9E3G4_9ROSI|nr:hypothetical protein [Gossypium trilobum]